MKIIDYCTIGASDLVDLDNVAKKTIKEGWQPFGGVIECKKLCGFIQAMVKYEEESKPDIKNRNLVDFETTWHSSDEYRKNRLDEMESRGYELFKKCSEPCGELMHYKLMVVKYER